MVKKNQSIGQLEENSLEGGMSKGNIPYFDKGLDYTSVYTGKNSSNCTIKFMISLCVS